MHGAWHGAWCWATLQAELDRRGVPSYAVDLPGRGTSDELLGDLYADTARVERALSGIGSEVVLVGHSYGGAVVTGAARDAGISAVVFLTGFALDVGETVMDIVHAHPEPEPKLAKAIVVGEDAVSVIDPALAAGALYGSCPPAAVAAAIPRLSPHSMTSFAQPATSAPLGRIPTTYVRCTLDEGVNLPQQDAMAERCDHVVTLETDHSPFMSAVDDVATLLQRLATEDRA